VRHISLLFLFLLVLSLFFPFFPLSSFSLKLPTSMVEKPKVERGRGERGRGKKRKKEISWAGGVTRGCNAFLEKVILRPSIHHPPLTHPSNWVCTANITSCIRSEASFQLHDFIRSNHLHALLGAPLSTTPFICVCPVTSHLQIQ
jgi:hypothetical protein